MLNFDNEILRDGADIMSHCYRTRKTMLNPIVDWSDKDVWDFLHHYGCESNPLYKCGNGRIGCVGCPLSGPKQQEKDFARYPKIRANYVRAFDRLLKAREAAGKDNQSWTDGESVMRWWLGDTTIDGQLSFFDEDEILDAMTEE